MNQNAIALRKTSRWVRNLAGVLEALICLSTVMMVVTTLAVISRWAGWTTPPDCRAEAGCIQLGSTEVSVPLDLWGFTYDFAWGLNNPLKLVIGLAQTVTDAMMVMALDHIRRLAGETHEWANDQARGVLLAVPSPFRAGVSARLRSIGTLLLAIPIGSFGFSVLLFPLAITFHKPLSVSFDIWQLLVLVMMGGLSLLLSRIFRYGAQLQNDVDGLL